MMDKNEKIKYLEDLIKEGKGIKIIYNSPELTTWGEVVRVALQNIFPKNDYAERFYSDLNQNFVGSFSMYDSKEVRQHKYDQFRLKCFDKAIAFLKSKIRELQDWPEDELAIANKKNASVSEILLIIDRFDLVTKQLRQRHDDRCTLDVEDEYDVQDLFHALLKLYFDDIRAEEWTPSYAGSSSRIDFFIPELELAIEIKKTRKGLGNKEAKEQLAIDKDHYRCKESIKHLICFVYDPDGRIQNPRGFEKDLAQKGPLKTDVYVRP